MLCGWCENEENEIKTKSWENFIGEEQWENLCGSSIQRKIQNQGTVVLDQIKTIKMLGNFVIVKLNTINFFLSFDSLIEIKNKELRMKVMRSNNFPDILSHFKKSQNSREDAKMEKLNGYILRLTQINEKDKKCELIIRMQFKGIL